MLGGHGVGPMNHPTLGALACIGDTCIMVSTLSSLSSQQIGWENLILSITNKYYEAIKQYYYVQLTKAWET
jgi:hypothetical protein